MAKHPSSHRKKHKKRKMTKQDKQTLTPFTITKIDETGGWTDKPFNIRDIGKKLQRRQKKQNKRIKRITGK